MNGENLNYENEENMINNNELYQFSNNNQDQYIDNLENRGEDLNQEGEEEEGGEEEEFKENNFQNNDNYNQNINNNYDENYQNNISSAYVNSIYNSNSLFSMRIKPNLIRLINQVFYSSELLDTILNYLNLIELTQFRALNRNILFIVHEYFKKRVKIEIDYITKYQDNNKEKVDFFMKNIDSQIPLSNKG